MLLLHCGGNRSCWVEKSLLGRETLSKSVHCFCGMWNFFFLMEFSEGVRVGESGCLRYDTLQSWCFCFNISDL